ncbi:MAG: IS1380 family transposase [Pseudonocardiaceae bacterium]
MADDDTTQCWLFRDLAQRPVTIRFEEEGGSSDGGAVLLAAADRGLGLSEALAGCIRDGRDSPRVVHEVSDLIRQRVYAIACGYADGNDAARLSADPVHKLVVGRDPLGEGDLASQPTLSRFENSVGRAGLFRLGEALAERVIERHRRRRRGRARVVTIDLDQTDDPAHGQQQLAMFNGYYGQWCFLPLLGFVSFDDEADQYLVAAVLRPGNSPDKVGSLGVLSRLLPRLRKAFPKARFRVRLDAGFAAPEVLDFLDAEGVDYAVAMGKNSVLLKKAGKHMAQARRLSKASGETAHVYDETLYAAKTWPRRRRIIIKAEVTRHPGRDPKDNPRFVITNMTQTPRWVYEDFYCRRGEIENRIKELHHGLEIDRTSCSRFLANQLRVLLTAAAYVLMQELRLRAARTKLARAQVSTLRDAVLKIGARVTTSVRRIVLHLPVSFPYAHAWGLIARSLGASAG